LLYSQLDDSRLEIRKIEVYSNGSAGWADRSSEHGSARLGIVPLPSLDEIATVLRGHIGFGHSSHIHTTKIMRLSQDLPVIVEIVDSKEKIDLFLPVLDEMMSSGLVTIEKVQVLQYGETKPT
jgi:hypothetical protein